MKFFKYLIGILGLLTAMSLGSFALASETTRITLTVTDEPLAQVLQRIEKQSGVETVLVGKEWQDVPVTCSVKNSELERALGTILSGYNYTLAFQAEQNEISKVLVTVYEKKEGVAMPVMKTSVSTIQSTNGDQKVLSGRELTVYMAAEVERRRKLGIVTPGITEEQRLDAPTMADMVQRISKVK